MIEKNKDYRYEYNAWEGCDEEKILVHSHIPFLSDKQKFLIIMSKRESINK